MLDLNPYILSLLPKVLFIVNVDWFFVSHRLPIAQAANKKGFEVHVASSFTGSQGIIEESGIAVHKLNLDRSSFGIIENFKIFIEIINLIKRIRPSVIHLVTIKPVLMGCFAAKLFNYPLNIVASVSGLGTIFIHQGFLAKVRRLIISAIYRLAFSNSNLKVIFQNSDDLYKISRISALPRYKTVLIPGSGVDLSLFKMTPPPIGRPKILFAARLLTSKGIYEYLYAAKKLFNIADFFILGKLDFDNRDSISEDLFDEFIKSGYITYLGFSENMVQSISNSSLVILPSYREGLPKVLIEAAACGRPVITTDTPGCRDAIIPNETGLLVAPRDKEGLVSSIKILLNDPNLMIRMGKKGRQLAEDKFDINDVIKTHLEIYNQFSDSTK